MGAGDPAYRFNEQLIWGATGTQNKRRPYEKERETASIQPKDLCEIGGRGRVRIFFFEAGLQAFHQDVKHGDEN
jgi:hypothetical protein